jgi:hypothetical protein
MNPKTAHTGLTEARTSPLRLSVAILILCRDGLLLCVLERDHPTLDSTDGLLLRVLECERPTVESEDMLLLLVLERWPGAFLDRGFRRARPRPRRGISESKFNFRIQPLFHNQYKNNL